MTRIELIQKIINKKKISKYLEIGTYEGKSFFSIRCKKKVAIDPKFNIPLKRKIKWVFKDYHNINNKYFELTSDDFFSKKQKFIKNYKPQIVFVDGLHTFKASLLDVLNSLKFLAADGVIVMHDCLPPNKAASTYANSFRQAVKMKLEGWTGEWTGDVWKTIIYLKNIYTDELDINVINTDYGLGYIKVNLPINNFEIDKESFEKINLLTFDDLLKDLSIINLKGLNYLEELL